MENTGNQTVKKQNKSKKLKIFITILTVLIVLAATYVLSVNGAIVNGTKSIIATAAEQFTEKPECIIILGAGVKEDGSLSNMLEDRLETGVSLYKSGVSDLILLTGDHSREDYDEVGAMLDYCVENGVPEDKIFTDYAGFSTYESMYRAKEIYEVKSAVVVTQEYHLYRALYIGRALGIEVYGFAADIREYRGAAYRSMREFVARNKDFIYTLTKPLPTYLGEKIPITGDYSASRE